MPVIKEPFELPETRGTVYPKPFSDGFEKRVKRRLTDPLGLTQFGVNITTLEPGAQSAHRHWHMVEDEFIYVIEGPITLVTNAGPTELTAGMAAGFPAGDPDGHHLINRANKPVHYLEIGTRSPNEEPVYPDVDLAGSKRDGAFTFTRKDGTPL